MPGAIFRVGGWYRFHGINPGNLAYIFKVGDPELNKANAIWLPTGTTCHIGVSRKEPSLNADEVPVDEVTDRMWEALGKAGLTGEIDL